MRKQEYEPYFMCMVLVSVVILAVNIYYVDSNVDFPQIVIEKGATKRGIQR